MCTDFNTTKSSNLMKIVKMTKLRDKFNCLDFWNNFSPNSDKHYSILNTDRESDIGNGTHFIGVYQDNNVLYIYDSFGRKHIMNEFVDTMNEIGFECRYINKKSDQCNLQQNCGIRSLLWLLFVDKYGIKQASKI